MRDFYILFAKPDTVMNIYLKTMNDDDDKEVVAHACTSVADIIREFGYMAMEPCKYDLVGISVLSPQVPVYLK